MDTEHILGKSDSAIQVTDFARCQSLINELVQQATSSLHIFDINLSTELFNSTIFIEALRHLLSSNSHSSIDVLVADTERSRRNAPQLFQLARRSPSHVQIRQSDRAYHHAFVVADTTGYLDHRMGTGHEAEVNFNHPAQARSLVGFFKDVWNRSPVPADAQGLNL
ncbi:hypothetical protein MNBD_GAMMA25-1861 [hydrothermal vent metagenome]|uniref:DUF7931 domain-containing protein n=1 Tax=hydrothermal vent metagenome TaxID=652676 RepID=A0A3B1BJM2_9ZZZZ